MPIPILACVTSFVLTLGVCVIMLRIAPRLGYLDLPSERKIHKRPVPLLGGVGIVSGFFVGAGWLWWGTRTADTVESPSFAVMLGCGLAIAIAGLVDDRYELQVRGKLGCQILPSAVLVAYLWSLRPEGGLSPFDCVFAFVFLIGLINTMNFQDNMDGLLAGCAAISAVGLSAAQSLGIPSHLSDGIPPLAPLVLTAACVGFLALNAPPARLFMGDAGSMFIGFVIGALGLAVAFGNVLAGVANTAMPLYPHVFLLLLFALPILDGGLVIVARLAHRRVLTAGSTDHVSHRLVALGLSPQAAVAVLHGVSLLLAGAAVLYGVTQSILVPLGALLLCAPALVKLYQAPVYGDESQCCVPAREQA